MGRPINFKGQRVILIKGSSEDKEHEINVTRTIEGAIFFTKNNSYDESFIYFYKDQIPNLIKTIKELREDLK